LVKNLESLDETGSVHGDNGVFFCGLVAHFTFETCSANTLGIDANTMTTAIEVAVVNVLTGTAVETEVAVTLTVKTDTFTGTVVRTGHGHLVGAGVAVEANVAVAGSKETIPVVIAIVRATVGEGTSNDERAVITTISTFAVADIVVADSMTGATNTVTTTTSPSDTLTDSDSGVVVSIKHDGNHLFIIVIDRNGTVLTGPAIRTVTHSVMALTIKGT